MRSQPIRFDSVTSERLLNWACALSDEPGTLLLHSGGGLDSARHSLLVAYPEEWFTLDASSSDPWGDFAEKLELSGCPKPEWVGYLGYEMGASTDFSIRLPCRTSSIPDAYFQRSALTVWVDHQSQQATVWGSEYLPTSSSAAQSLQPMRWKRKGTPWKRYAQQVESILNAILEGDVYQANLSQTFELEGECGGFALFEAVAQLNPAPFSAYLHTPFSQIISSSPERLLKYEKGILETRPIKGTIARGATAEEDMRRRQQLLESEKDCAELLMITDLMRNDLARISEVGSVQVEELRRCEGYHNVYHLLSVIRSKALPLAPAQLLRAVFPGGSITGCPKVRAMQVIDALEQRPRGIYTGSIGYFRGNGEFDFNIAIRTLLLKDERLSMSLGGAIVIDSEAESEYQECLDKGASIFQALGLSTPERHSDETACR